MAFSVTIFFSALLLFVVQLTMGKFILPRFGGAPAVWTTCILFFQIMLLLGYAYAHGIASRFSWRNQSRIHLTLLGISVAYLAVLLWKWHSPILPPDSFLSAGAPNPVFEIMRLLLVAVGLPYFLLSATSPLLQRWFSGLEGRKPYRLYAISNAGSMLGLLGYPFLIEPSIGLIHQANGWGIFYIFFAIGCAACALKISRVPLRPKENSNATNVNVPRPSGAVILIWLGLTASTSAMFLAVTNRLCQDVAVVPFLWVAPLAVYLLSFVICFDNDHWYRRRWFVLATAAASYWLLTHDSQRLPSSIPTQIFSHLTFLFLFCMTGHGELVRLKPAAQHLTLFYLVLALGGALGGIFVGLVAPLVFNGYHEFYLILFLGWLLWAIVLLRDRTSFFYAGDPWQFASVLLLVLVPVLAVVLEFTPLRHMVFYWKHTRSITYSAASLLTLTAVFLTWRNWARWKHWPRVLIGGMILYAGNQFLDQIKGNAEGTLAATRNFYGVVRVFEDSMRVEREMLPFRQLLHGQVNHGTQFLDPQFRDQPASYYARNSGIDLAFRQHPRRAKGEPIRIGVLGLGVGTMAAFANEGDTVIFYEINPEVENFSSGPDPFFTYIRNCKGGAEIKLGDGRMLLQEEVSARQPGQFDVLALDAFAGDSVPVHLLTVEAFEIYLQHLRDDEAIIAVNISNQYLDLEPLMSGLAARFGLNPVVIDSLGDYPDRTGSRWCLLTRNAELLVSKAFQEAKIRPEPEEKVLWTDDFSNLFRLLR